QHRHAGDPAVGLEVMQMNVQQGRIGGSDAPPQRLVDVVDIVEPLGTVEIDNEMRACTTHPVPHHEMIVPLLGPDVSLDQLGRYDRFGFLSGGTWGPQARTQLEGGLTHGVLPNQISNPSAGKPALRKANAAGTDPKRTTRSG